jgi:hypothetical protein
MEAGIEVSADGVESLPALVPKVGHFIFQFEYLNKEKMPSRHEFVEQLAAFLGRLPGDLPYAVEIRNPRWIGAVDDWEGDEDVGWRRVPLTSAGCNHILTL